ncbi:hypothetical protein EJ05DRAFT_482540 [Pseudovirgaria hyperparasitica]|uniref:Uncharacterized protein n=1 Tax=Pseudovirgaria hyperparasitica TaxID=470096 RepID=A0A6A6WFT4_9PEZI|nr:uncharacterized protein EJ05DRAFT_482540 [Pseudovirgaria hyperparasitica]KAF2761692.1 hypothetical protein EJ05DRAFT_482540 [Pseudovirgaria hyperparasitica]
MFHQGLHVERHFSTSRSLSGLSHNLLSPSDSCKTSYVSEFALPVTSENLSKNTNTTCPLFRLSLELRILIYEHLLAHLATNLDSIDAGDIGSRYEEVHLNREPKDSGKGGLSILRTNKRISNEVLDVLYCRPFSLKLSSLNRDIPVLWMTPGVWPRITRLLFIVDVNDVVSTECGEANWRLKKILTNVKRIDMIVVNPHADRAVVGFENKQQKGVNEWERRFIELLELLWTHTPWDSVFMIDVDGIGEVRDIVRSAFEGSPDRCRIGPFKAGDIYFNRAISSNTVLQRSLLMKHESRLR